MQRIDRRDRMAGGERDELVEAGGEQSLIRERAGVSVSNPDLMPNA
jgi:hypothetical protein